MLSPVLPQSSLPIPQQRNALLHDCRLFLAQHEAPLLAALDAVAGAPAVRDAAKLVEAVQAAPDWLPHPTRQLERLYGYLTLEHLDDPFGPFPIDPAALDPAGAIAESCCWHADRLCDFIERSDDIQARTLAHPRDPRALLRKPMRT